MIDLNQYRGYAPVLLRVGVSLVFLWFGVNQLINPESFLGYVPQWLLPHQGMMMHEHPLQFMHNIPKPSVHIIIMGNGAFETLFGVFLLLGIFTRASSLLLSIHLFGIMASLGYNDIAVRDFGLALSAFSVFLNGADRWSLDNKINSKLFKQRGL